MTSTFPINVKTRAKLVPMKVKHFLKSPVGYVTTVKKKFGISLARHVMLTRTLWQTAPSCHFQDPITRCANKIPGNKQVYMKKLKALKQIQVQNWWDLEDVVRDRSIWATNRSRCAIGRSIVRAAIGRFRSYRSRNEHNCAIAQRDRSIA